MFITYPAPITLHYNYTFGVFTSLLTNNSLLVILFSFLILILSLYYNKIQQYFTIKFNYLVLAPMFYNPLIRIDQLEKAGQLTEADSLRINLFEFTKLAFDNNIHFSTIKGVAAELKGWLLTPHYFRGFGNSLLSSASDNPDLANSILDKLVRLYDFLPIYTFTLPGVENSSLPTTSATSSSLVPSSLPQPAVNDSVSAGSMVTISASNPPSVPGTDSWVTTMLAFCSDHKVSLVIGTIVVGIAIWYIKEYYYNDPVTDVIEDNTLLSVAEDFSFYIFISHIFYLFLFFIFFWFLKMSFTKLNFNINNTL
jgi:hypothetical protein